VRIHNGVPLLIIGLLLSIHLAAYGKITNSKTSPTPLLKGEVDILTSSCEAAGITLSSEKLPATVVQVRMGSPAFYKGISKDDSVLSAQITNDKILLSLQRSGKTYATDLNVRPQAPQTSHTVASGGVKVNELQASLAVRIDLPSGPPRFQLVAETFSTPDGKSGWLTSPAGRLSDIRTPTYSAGTIFVSEGINTHELVALDAKTGAVRWKFATEEADSGPTRAVIEDDLCAFNTACCTAYVVNAKTGLPLWHERIADSLDTQPAAKNGLLYIAYPNWHHSLPHEPVPGNLAGLLCVDIRTGKHIWDSPLTHLAISAPVIDGNKVYVTCKDANTTCFDALTGQILWTKQTIAGSAPLVVQGALIASDSETRDPASWGYEGPRPAYANGLVIKLNGDIAEASELLSGKLRWRVSLSQFIGSETPPGGQRIFGPSIGVNNAYFTTSSGHILALGLSDGKVNLFYSTGQPFDCQPCLANGFIYVGTADGRLISINVGADANGWTAWGGNAQHNISN
jgi:outer membrane protein assembly factor BamB